jgi:hypothetical protein
MPTREPRSAQAITGIPFAKFAIDASGAARWLGTG